MIEDNIPGFVQICNQLSPEVVKAQHDAEMRNLAEYRRRHIQALLDWSDPVKRAALIAKWEEERTLSWNNLKDIPAEQIAVRRGFDKPSFILKLLPDIGNYKPQGKVQRLKIWIRRALRMR